MIRTLASALTLLLIGMHMAFAAPADDVCAALMEARGYLVAMLGRADKAGNDDLKGKVHTASAKLDGILATMAYSDAAKVSAFKAVWGDFKKTRETEIIPAIYAGKNANAKAIASAIQAEPMGKMKPPWAAIRARPGIEPNLACRLRLKTG